MRPFVLKMKEDTTWQCSKNTIFITDDGLARSFKAGKLLSHICGFPSIKVYQNFFFNLVRIILQSNSEIMTFLSKIRLSKPFE